VRRSAALPLSTGDHPVDGDGSRRRRAGRSAGDFFLAPFRARAPPEEMIVDQAGKLVWFPPPANDAATNFHPKTYDGQTS